MTVNVSKEEFEERWYVADKGEDVYTDGHLKGTIQYEDDNYFVIKLIKD